MPPLFTGRCASPCATLYLNSAKREKEKALIMWYEPITIIWMERKTHLESTINSGQLILCMITFFTQTHARRLKGQMKAESEINEIMLHLFFFL